MELSHPAPLPARPPLLQQARHAKARFQVIQVNRNHIAVADQPICIACDQPITSPDLYANR